MWTSALRWLPRIALRTSPVGNGIRPRSLKRALPNLYATTGPSHSRLFSTNTVLQESVQTSIKGVTHDARSRVVSLALQNGRKLIYPVVWLRDSCLCSKCHNPSSISRLLLVKDLDPEVELTSIQVSEDGQSLTCEWSDGHRSSFQVSWLKDRSFDPHEQLARLNEDEPPQRLWSGGSFSLPKFSFEKVSSDDTVLLEFLSTLHETGLVLVEGCPETTDDHAYTVRELSRRAVNSQVHQTNYGTTFEVMTVANPNNAAYTNSELGLHTDLPFYSHPPNIQVLHCIRQCAEGGGSLFADGFYAARLLKQKNPDAYRLLTTLPVDYYDLGRSDYDFHLHYRRPVLETNQDGEVTNINYNQQVRDYTLNVPLDLVQPLYNAMAEFNRIILQHVHTVRLGDGDTILFDNRRVLHGREEIVKDNDKGRHLQGIYWSWDEAKSTMRVLRRKTITQADAY